jgi:hypothetical protein
MESVQRIVKEATAKIEQADQELDAVDEILKENPSMTKDALKQTPTLKKALNTVELSRNSSHSAHTVLMEFQLLAVAYIITDPSKLQLLSKETEDLVKKWHDAQKKMGKHLEAIRVEADKR